MTTSNLSTLEGVHSQLQAYTMPCFASKLHQFNDEDENQLSLWQHWL